MKNPIIRKFFVWFFFAAGIMLICTSANADSNVSIFYGSQSGKATLDQGEGGGNPFASSLVELLKKPSLTFDEFDGKLIRLTRKKSHRFQRPEVVGGDEIPISWRIKPVPESTKRVALVFVYSDYASSGVSTLPGAAKDLERVKLALGMAGFEVEAIANPTKKELHTALKVLSKRSADAEAAIIYMTGHGFEHEGKVYLAPSDFPFEEGPESLDQKAIQVPNLAQYLNGKIANLLFYGGCRSNM